MHFKSLELFGFKSFADRTRLDFEPGMTAIVGPNGCGKSNVSDSIKWVLGEQSAKMLRGGKMEDVIFNGTDGKEPVNYAEVSLTLSNKDRALSIEYDEVTVTRRLYRSGESEYLLNKTPVRLKDINELFMGTGIGQSSYSLIEQGRIDQVLSSKPEERREIFEEASGITKYKSKKKEALRRVDDTEQNLLRINDIIQEVKRQINSIERQAKKAERYKVRYDELKDLELKLSRIELEVLNKNLSESDVNLDELKTKETQFNKDLLSLGENLTGFTSKRADLESKKMDFKSNIIETDSEISKSTNQLNLNRERIEELQKRRVDLESEIGKSENSISSQQKEVDGLTQQVETLETEDLHRTTTLSENEARLKEISKLIGDNETIISTSKANLVDIAAREAKMRNQLAKISTTLGTHDARLKRLGTEKETVGDEKSTLEARLAEIVSEIERITGECSSLRAEKDEISLDLTQVTEKIDKLQLELEDVRGKLTTDRSRLEVLEEAKARYEGFSSGVRSLLGKDPSRQKHELLGLRDVLANLVSVDKGYEIALEASFGDYLQSIVVDTPDAASKAIDYLKENTCGKALFIYPHAYTAKDSKIPFMRKASPELHIDSDKVLGKAIDFVKVNGDLRDVVEYLLKNILIVRNLQDGQSVLEANQDIDGCKCVTLQGEILGNGFVLGGDVGKDGSTFVNRELKIKELSESIVTLEADLHRCETEKADSESKKLELVKTLEELVASLNEKEISLANSSSRKEAVEENIKGVLDEIALLNLEIDEVTQEIENLKTEEVSLTESLEQAEKDLDLNQGQIKTSEGLIHEKAGEKETLLIKIAEERTELGTLESKKEGLSNTLNILESSLQDLKKTLESRRQEMGSAAQKISQLSEEMVSIEESMTLFSTNRTKHNSELEDVESKYAEIMANIEEREKVYRETEKGMNGIKEDLHKFDLQKAETNYGIDNLKQRIKDVYKLDLGEIEFDESWHDVEKDILKSDVEEKRAKLDSMGTVNLVAIEEHTELQERFAFLTHQRDDLLNAKDALLKAITKINKTTKELFMETFLNIQQEFRGFFKMLFGGGDGELMLLDEGNVLESGIEIVARPPGKRLQNVSLLSGGEKALTAIALIFAIFKVKPSPFCVLDEIDAALDESNVDRFSRSLNLFVETSQFIVITHNKKTIDKADVMYGITMQQSGISKVVSVKFLDTKKGKAVEVKD